MKCLEDYTIEQVKEMSYEELTVLCNKISEEQREIDMRATVVGMLEIMGAENR